MEGYIKKAMDSYESSGIKSTNKALLEKESKLRDVRYLINVHFCLDSFKKKIEDKFFENNNLGSISIELINSPNNRYNQIKFNLFLINGEKFWDYDKNGDYKEAYKQVKDILDKLLFYSPMTSQEFVENKEFNFKLNSAGIKEMQNLLLNKELSVALDYEVMNRTIVGKAENIPRQKI